MLQMIFEIFYGGLLVFELQSKLRWHAEVDRWPLKKSIKNLNAESNNSDILAEAEYIINNADEILAGFDCEVLAA